MFHGSYLDQACFLGPNGTAFDDFLARGGRGVPAAPAGLRGGVRGHARGAAGGSGATAAGARGAEAAPGGSQRGDPTEPEGRLSTSLVLHDG